MSREWELYLKDILDSIDKISAYTEGQSRVEFFNDSRTYDAVVRNLEIVGEATKNVPAEVRAKIPDVPWVQISAMRNILAHAYFGIDEDILWDVMEHHLPVVRQAVSKFLQSGTSKSD